MGEILVVFTITGNKRKQRYYDRFYNDPHYYRDRGLDPPPFGFGLNSPGLGSC
jgi:hypothetical protein